MTKKLCLKRVSMYTSIYSRGKYYYDLQLECGHFRIVSRPKQRVNCIECSKSEIQ